MNKSKLAVGLLTGLLSVGALTGCSNEVAYTSDGSILTYYDNKGTLVIKTADKILDDYFEDSSKYQSIFDSIYSILVRNYFNNVEKVGDVELGKKDKEQIDKDAAAKARADQRTAETNADKNNTSYKEEWNAILSSHGAEDFDELVEKYADELMQKKFEENFNKYHINEIKEGDVNVKMVGTEKQLWDGYFKDQVPYHVSHILVKLTDSSGTNYSNGTISKENAHKLYDVVNLLATQGINHKESFVSIAKTKSEDEGSAKLGGDLGIMDYSTSFVNEFKLGLYAYENLFAQGLGSDKSVIGFGRSDEMTKIGENYEKYSKEAFGNEFPSIPFSVFKDLDDEAEIVKDLNREDVIENVENFYPRNVIYNKYLNRHQIAFIESDTALDLEGADAGRTCGFKKFEEADLIPGLVGKTVLATLVAGQWQPIVVTRGGSGYEGIHFMVINRSSFVDVNKEGVALRDYYTTFNPEQSSYPDVGDAKTFVNFSSTKYEDTSKRAEEFSSKLKSFDSDKMKKYIFIKYLTDPEQHIKFADGATALRDNLIEWINRGFEKTTSETQESFEKTWKSYLDAIVRQNSERKKLVSQGCRVAYLYGNDKTSFDGEATDEKVIKVNAILDQIAKAMLDAGEYNGEATEEAAKLAELKAAIKSTEFDEKVESIYDLFNKKGALCNDGKDHK